MIGLFFSEKRSFPIYCLNNNKDRIIHYLEDVIGFIKVSIASAAIIYSGFLSLEALSFLFRESLTKDRNLC